MVSHRISGGVISKANTPVVAIQMAWVLRPFIGSPGNPVQFFRAESWGNAFVILGRGLWGALFGAELRSGSG